MVATSWNAEHNSLQEPVAPQPPMPPAAASPRSRHRAGAAEEEEVSELCVIVYQPRWFFGGAPSSQRVYVPKPTRWPVPLSSLRTPDLTQSLPTH